VFLCPSVHGEIGEVTLNQIYGQVVGSSYYLRTNFWSASERLGATHFVGVAGVYGRLGDAITINGVLGDDHLNGVFTSRSKTRMAQIEDGAPYTLMFGEAPGTCGTNIGGLHSTGVFNDWIVANAWAATATVPVVYGLDSSFENNRPNQGARYDVKWGYFGSLHPAGVNFCFADGSVRALQKSIDRQLLYKLSTIRGADDAGSDE
jgi:prepilin-type processing-associated H-X9-DG protein